MTTQLPPAALYGPAPAARGGTSSPQGTHVRDHRTVSPNLVLFPPLRVEFRGGTLAAPAAITANAKAVLELPPWKGEFTSVRVLLDQAGDIVIDIWKDAYANYLPTVADTITASAKPTISAGTKYESTTLTGWARHFAPGDILLFNVDSIATATWCVVSLTFRAG